MANETETAGTIALPAGTFRDLDQNVVTGSIFLQPFESRILIADDSVLLADGFESGDTSGWSSSVPP